MSYQIYNSYNGLVTDAKSKHRIKYDGGPYYEIHHIVPRSEGGQDTEDNLVLLTLWEHFQAHYLLAKQYENDVANQQKFFANISACELLLTGKSTHQNKLDEVSKFILDPHCFEIIENSKIMAHKRSPAIKGKVYIMKDGVRKCIDANQVTNYLKCGWVKQKEIAKWFQLKFQRPVKVAEKSWQKYLDKGYKKLDSCPVCGEVYSEQSFACCAEHEQQYLNKCKEDYKQLKADQSKAMWTDDSLKAKISSSIKSTHDTKHFSEGYIWMNNGSKSIRVKNFEKDSFKSQGYVEGRLKLGKFDITEDQREKMAKRMADQQKNMISVCKDGKHIRILKTNLDKYLQEGFHLA